MSPADVATPTKDHRDFARAIVRSWSNGLTEYARREAVSVHDLTQLQESIAFAMARRDAQSAEALP